MCEHYLVFRKNNKEMKIVREIATWKINNYTWGHILFYLKKHEVSFCLFSCFVTKCWCFFGMMQLIDPKNVFSNTRSSCRYAARNRRNRMYNKFLPNSRNCWRSDRTTTLIDGKNIACRWCWDVVYLQEVVIMAVLDEGYAHSVGYALAWWSVNRGAYGRTSPALWCMRCMSLIWTDRCSCSFCARSSLRTSKEARNNGLIQAHYFLLRSGMSCCLAS